MDATLAFPLLIALVGIALLFDFLNGLHDAANSIATIVSTRVLRPQYAVMWAAFFNFIAFLFFGLHVAETLGKGIIDPGIAPLATDTDGNLRRLMGALQLIRADPAFAGVHLSVGLSNFTVMLPPKRADGSPVKAPLASGFLTRAMPLGLDMVIGSVRQAYTLLPEGHPALQCFDACLAAEGFDGLEIVQAFYS